MSEKPPIDHMSITIREYTGESIDVYLEPTHLINNADYYKEATLRFTLSGAEFSIIGLTQVALRKLADALKAFAVDMDSKEIEAM